MRHVKFEEARILIEAGQAVLLTGEAGSGKTTMAIQIAEELGLKFSSVSMTRQTTLSYLLGFMNVKGKYIPSLLRIAAEFGGMFLMDELDAADPNVVLALNTIENGFISFPDKIVKLHKDFRWVATANPADEHSHYTGRSKLDGATLDRFDEIDVPRDEKLEAALVDPETFRHMNAAREVLMAMNSQKRITMRDSMRYQVRKKLDLLDGVVYKILGKNPGAEKKYIEVVASMPKHADQKDCTNFEELLDLVFVQTGRKYDGNTDYRVDFNQSEAPKQKSDADDPYTATGTEKASAQAAKAARVKKAFNDSAPPRSDSAPNF